jgi:hypothetical protein
MNRRLRPIAVAALALVLFAPAGMGAGGTPTVAEAIRRGVAFLVRTQNRDGSWGSPAPTLTVDIYAPSPACHDAYAMGTTGLAVAALAEAGAGEPGVDGAVRRGVDWMIAHGDLRRGTTDVLYNVWGHAYALEAYARVLRIEKDGARREAIRKAAAEQVARLSRFEYVDGGWGYYDFQTRTKKPGPGTTSFMTATCLVSLRLAAAEGVDVPKGLVERGLEVIRRSRFPNGAFSYSIELRLLPQMPVNKVKGSLARTPACLVAMNDWGAAPPEAAVAKALDDLEKEGRFLLIARKYTYPHEAWYQNSGYFCFYGYFYASRLLDLLPEGKRPPERARIASHLLPLQEPDGSFWDYQLYGYHKAYGTAYVLMALHRCR